LNSIKGLLGWIPLVLSVLMAVVTYLVDIDSEMAKMNADTEKTE